MALCLQLGWRAQGYFSSVATGKRAPSHDFATGIERASVGAVYVGLILIYGLWLFA